MGKKNTQQSSSGPYDDMIELGASPVPGLTLAQVFRGHSGHIGLMAWSPDGRLLASPSFDGTVRIWDVDAGGKVRVIEAHDDWVFSASWSPDGQRLATGSKNDTIAIWDVATGQCLRRLTGHGGSVFQVLWITDDTLGSSCSDGTVRIWNSAGDNKLSKVGYVEIALSPDRRTLALVTNQGQLSLMDTLTWTETRAWDANIKAPTCCWTPDGHSLLTGGDLDAARILVWDVSTGLHKATLEGHTGVIRHLDLSPDGSVLASKSRDGSVRFWHGKDWRSLATIAESVDLEHSGGGSDVKGLAFCPTRPLLASLAHNDHLIRIWRVDVEALLGASSRAESVRYTSAKIVLIGDSGAGKTGLGWRLSQGEFKEHASTHGQQFWPWKELDTVRSDGTQCEAVLWDLAGQPDYRLIHSLFLSDADLALIVFDPTRGDDPLHAVEFWLKQLRIGAGGGGPSTILVAARTDRGEGGLTHDDLTSFCAQQQILGFFSTSALLGRGVAELAAQIKTAIAWDAKPATVTTETFKRIKEDVLSLKEDVFAKRKIVTIDELSRHVSRNADGRPFSESELMTAVGHLETHGYVKRLRTSSGETRVLLAPELLNNIAASMVLEARRNPKGLGSLDEQQLLDQQYSLREFEVLSSDERTILLDAATLLFLDHHLCVRETDPLSARSYLIFPELINLKKPMMGDAQPTEDGAAYTVTGAVENVYASLVVLLGYTTMFTRTNQWHNHARYEIGNGLVCGVRLDAERAGELDFVLYFGDTVGATVRTLFQSLFESFLGRKNVSVVRYDPVACANGHRLNRAVVRDYVRTGKTEAFCNECGQRLAIRTGEAIQLTTTEANEVQSQRRAADRRSRFEQALFRLQAHVKEAAIEAPQCFISYAWGNPDQERWVERNLATDLQKAGLVVVLDRWDNQRIGASVARFVDRIAAADRVLIVGTPEYRRKYDNKRPMGGYVAAAEGDLIGKRMLGSEESKQSALPLLLEGTEDNALPPLLQGRVYADFRDPQQYVRVMFDVILSLYAIPVTDPSVAYLRESLAE
jgi:small GTP-binding protein